MIYAELSLGDWGWNLIGHNIDKRLSHGEVYYITILNELVQEGWILCSVVEYKKKYILYNLNYKRDNICGK